MRQRLGLATALLGDPGVLVLDEPSNGLDPEGIRWMRSLLRHLAEEGRTVLISSHLLAEVQQTVDALLIISRGRLVFQGGIEDLADPDEYATVVDSPDRAALSRLLEDRGIDHQLLRNGFTIRHHEPVEIGALAAGAGIALSNLQSRGASLEDIFLELVSGVRVHASAGAVSAPVSDPTPEGLPVPDAGRIADAETPAPAPIVGPEPTASADLDDDVRPSTALVAVMPPPRSARSAGAAADDGLRPSYSVASTGVIDIVPSAAPDETEAPR
jgi:ABC-2 type transport system ATP-binding protein